MSNASEADPRDDRTEVIEPDGPPPAQEQGNGLGIASLAVGIVAAVLAILPFDWAWIAGAVLAAVGLVLGIVGLTRADRPKGVATAGTVVSAAALVLAVILGILYGTGVLGGEAAVPTASPTASATVPASPTETPTPTPTETPTATVQEWADETWGTFSPVEQDGSGDAVISIPAGAVGGIVTATSDGDGFTLTLLDATDSPSGAPLVEAADDYDGTTAWGVPDASSATSLQVTASGSWTVRIEPMSSAPELPNAVNGDGDAVFLYGGEAATLAATHSGDDAEAPFVVAQQAEQAFGGARLIDVTGPYDGTVPLAAGPSLLTLQADEDWTLSVG